MLPSPSPRFYLVGVILSGAGALLLAMRGARGRAPEPRPRMLLAVTVLTLAAGVALIGAGLWIDVERAQKENTTVLSYNVSVRLNGTGSVRLVLPAPADPRFFASLNTTNGSSTLRLVHTPSETSVVLTVYGNVTFNVRSELATTVGNWNFTRLIPLTNGIPGSGLNASIERSSAAPEAVVFLELYASIGSFCESHFLSVDAAVHEGVGEYPTQSGLMVC